jgi:serine/threonine-protein phosphatase 2A regulatory subunit A
LVIYVCNCSITEDGGNENISKIQSIVDDLRSEDVQVRAKSMKQIKDVARALGPARTKDELLNFLSQLVGDEDNVLEVMAEELGGFVELVGGPEHIDVILEPLEQLCVAQDSKVREAVCFFLQISSH